MNAREYRCFVFDMDGTLFSIPVDWTSARREVERISGQRLDRRHLFVQIREIVARRPDLRSPLFTSIDSFEMKAAPGAKPLEGAIDLIATLAGGSKLALVTMQGNQVCRELSRAYGLEKYFGAFVTRENSLDRGEQILMAIRAVNSSTQITLFIGDTANDVSSARRVKIDVAIMGGRSPAELTPDHSFLSYGELRAFLA